MPVLTQFLHELYGWRGALLLIGGLNLHILVCGSTLRASTRYVSNDNTSLTTKGNDKHQQNCVSTFVSKLGLNLLLTDIYVLSLMIIAAGAGYIIIGWTIYLVPHALDIGYRSYDAALLSTVGGLGHLVGCAIFPLVAKVLSNKQIMYGTTILSSVALLLDPMSAVYHSYAGLMVSCVTVGICRAIIFVVLFKIINEEIHNDIKTTVISWIYFFECCGSLLSGFLSGLYIFMFLSQFHSFLNLKTIRLCRRHGSISGPRAPHAIVSTSSPRLRARELQIIDP